MSDNDNHQPISGKLYRVANCAWKSLSTHEGPRRVFGRYFDFDSATQFLLCLPRREDLPRYDFFLVSGSGEVLVWEDDPELWLTTEKMWMPDGFGMIYWLEEVKTEEE